MARPISRPALMLAEAAGLGALVAAALGGPASAATNPSIPCPTMSTPTWATSTAKPGSKPSVSPGTTPGVNAPTTLPGGVVLTPTCRPAPPSPLPGPTIAPEHTIGGPRLAGDGVIVDAPASVPAPPAVIDTSWTISDLDTGQILAAKNPHALLYPASTIKTLLFLTVSGTLDPKTVVTGHADEVAAEGTRVGMIAGNPYTIGDLYSGLIMVSGNDTAYALANAYGGRAATLAAMNSLAGSLGAWDTVVKDPSGLDEPDQRSSAYDLALFGRAVMAIPSFRTYAVQTSYTFPGGTDQSTGKTYPPFQLANHNQLLGKYPGTIGVKNGFTTLAQQTYIGAVQRGSRTLLITQMGGIGVPSAPRSAALLDWAFANADQLTPVGTLVAKGSAAAARPPELAGPTGPAGSAAPGSTAAGSSGAATPTTAAAPGRTGDPVAAAGGGPAQNEPGWRTVVGPAERTPWATGAGVALLLAAGVEVLRRGLRRRRTDPA